MPKQNEKWGGGRFSKHNSVFAKILLAYYKIAFFLKKSTDSESEKSDRLKPINKLKKERKGEKGNDDTHSKSEKTVDASIILENTKMRYKEI